MELFDALNTYYSTHDEDGRLRTQAGSVEFLTTVRYVERYLKPGMRVLEIGAATGRYAHYFAQRGYAVDAVELIPHNIELFRRYTQKGENIRIFQGNALELNMLENEQYDLVLLLGPMYHLYTLAPKRQALSEALRVLKWGGMLFVAYCLVDSSIIQYAFGKNKWKELLEKELLILPSFSARSTPEELFEIIRIEDIESINAGFPVHRKHLIGTDMLVHYLGAVVEEMDQETFQFYLQYHFFLCERKDMIGLSNHALDILEKIHPIDRETLDKKEGIL